MGLFHDTIHDGETFSQAVRHYAAAGAAANGGQYAHCMAKGFNRHQSAWAMAYGLRLQWRLQESGIETTDLDWPAMIRLAKACGPVAIVELQSICRHLAKQYQGTEYVWLYGFWSDGASGHSHASHPPCICGCLKCGRFFYQYGRRNACNGCQRKAERNKKRNQRGTDLSERLCPVCSTAFTPKRSDARCCSGKCRAKLSRQEAKQQG